MLGCKVGNGQLFYVLSLDNCTAFDQMVNSGIMPVAGSKVQRSAVADTPGFDIRTAVEQYTGRFFVSFLGGVVQSSA